jgi:hypothetical protein
MSVQTKCKVSSLQSAYWPYAPVVLLIGAKLQPRRFTAVGERRRPSSGVCGGAAAFVQ